MTQDLKHETVPSQSPKPFLSAMRSEDDGNPSPTDPSWLLLRSKSKVVRRQCGTQLNQDHARSYLTKAIYSGGNPKRIASLIQRKLALDDAHIEPRFGNVVNLLCGSTCENSEV